MLLMGLVSPRLRRVFYLIMGVMKVLGIFDKGSLDGVSGVKLQSKKPREKVGGEKNGIWGTLEKFVVKEKFRGGEWYGNSGRNVGLKFFYV